MKGGRIVKIKVKGFMTYDDLEIVPKSGLNLIIGLNGSGKSSIMSAICLGLAGKPHLTGKSAQPADFIKHGHTKASVTIELEEPKGRNVVITRTIQPDKSTYMLNGSTASQGDVSTVVKKFNIDVGNLCQFLPQEKVVEFSKMDKKQRLENMLQAIGEPQMFSTFEELKTMRIDCNDLEKKLTSMSDDKTSEERINSRLKTEVDKHQARKKLQEDLKMLRLKKTMAKYEEAKNAVQEIKKVKVSLLKEKQKTQQEIGNFEAAINSYASERDTCSREIKAKQARTTLLSEKLSKNSNELSLLHEKVHLAKIDFKNKITEKMNQKAKLKELKIQIKFLSEQHAQLKGKQEDTKNRTAQNLSNHEELKKLLSELDSKMEEIKLEINRLDYTQKRTLDFIDKMKNQEEKKMKILQQTSKHTYEAVRWLQENMASFKAPICLPALVSINVSDYNNCKFIENSVGYNDLLTFVCQDKEDVKRLTNILRVEKKLAIHTACVSMDATTSFRSPTITTDMRRLGLKCFLTDLFQAPEPVMRYLCQIYSIHKVPICQDSAEQNVDALLQHFKVFFTQTQKFSGTRSMYGARNLSVRTNSIVVKNFLLNSKDQSEQLQQLEAELKNCQETSAKYKEEFEVLKNKRIALERRQEQLRAERLELLEETRKFSNITMQLQQKHELYSRKEKEVIDEKAEKEKETEKICTINAEKISILADICSLLKEYCNLKKEIAKHIPLAKFFSNKVTATMDKLKECKNQLDEVEKKYQETDQEFVRVKAIAKKHLAILEATDKAYLNEVMVTEALSLEEIEQRIMNIQAQLEINCEENQAAVQEYEERQRSIIRAEKSIEECEKQIKRLKAAIDSKKKGWLGRLEMHINNINSKFTQYYKFLKCAGEINLDKSEDPDNFLKYGLQIRLKYRADEEFMELSQTHHSGGECSVAAIIFILSLQELTSVPFRCIDEINQGMDAVNERKIYQLIADASKSGSSCTQYFLLTPKLLMDLAYHKDVAVHIIYNSPFLKMGLDLKAHLKKVSSSN